MCEHNSIGSDHVYKKTAVLPMDFEDNSRAQLLMITNVQPQSAAHLRFYNGYYTKRMIVFNNKVLKSCRSLMDVVVCTRVF